MNILHACCCLQQNMLSLPVGEAAKESDQEHTGRAEFRMKALRDLEIDRVVELWIDAVRDQPELIGTSTLGDESDCRRRLRVAAESC